jgi:hypothetical protein
VVAGDELAVEAGWLAANAGRDRAEAVRHGELAARAGLIE